VTQQAMVATLERSQWAWHELVPLLCGALPESDQDGIAGVIDHMVALGFLMDMDGVLQIGPMTEQQFGRAHYKDLLASFTGVQLLLGRFGNIEVAYIDPHHPHRRRSRSFDPSIREKLAHHRRGLEQARGLAGTGQGRRQSSLDW
jgi:hypothetical protein